MEFSETGYKFTESQKKFYQITEESLQIPIL